MAYLILKMGETPEELNKGNYYILVYKPVRRYNEQRLFNDIRRFAKNANDIPTLLVNYLQWYNNYIISTQTPPFLFVSPYFYDFPGYRMTFVMSYEKQYGKGFHYGFIRTYRNPSEVKTWFEEKPIDLYTQTSYNVTKTYVYFSDRAGRYLSGLIMYSDLCQTLVPLAGQLSKPKNLTYSPTQMYTLLRLGLPFTVPMYTEGLAMESISSGNVFGKTFRLQQGEAGIMVNYEFYDSTIQVNNNTYNGDFNELLSSLCGV